MNKIVAYGKLLRIPGLGGLATPAVFGAISVGVLDFYSLLILFVIGAFAVIYGFVLNDFVDVELDKLVKELHGKPLVGGDIPRKNAITISVFCIFFAFLFIFILWYGKIFDGYKFVALLCIFFAGILGTIYNLYGKKIVGSDFFVAISMALVVLFGSLSFGKPTIITWAFFLLVFNQTLHMNAVEGGIKDADHDFIIGVKNIALSSGVKVDGEKIFIPNHFKAFGLAIRIFSAFLFFVPFVVFGYDYYLWQIVLLALLTFVFLYLSVKLVTIKTYDRNTIRKYIGVQSFLGYSLIPIMLISIIGVLYSIILIVLPVVWYIISAPLLEEKLFRPRM